MSEQVVVHENNVLARPEDVQPRMAPHDINKLIAVEVYSKQVRQTLLSLDADNISFQARGKVPITLYLNDKAVEVDLPIKSIPEYLHSEINQRYNKLAASVARTRNPVTGDWEQDFNHPGYDEITVKLIEENRQVRFKKILHGIDIPLKRGGKVVWDNNPDGARNETEALMAIEAMKLSDAQLADIAIAIDALTIEVQNDDIEDFKKKQEQP